MLFVGVVVYVVLAGQQPEGKQCDGISSIWGLQYGAEQYSILGNSMLSFTVEAETGYVTKGKGYFSERYNADMLKKTIKGPIWSV